MGVTKFSTAHITHCARSVMDFTCRLLVLRLYSFKSVLRRS